MSCGKGILHKPQELLDLLRELLIGLSMPAQGMGGRRVGARRAPQADVDTPGGIAASMLNCSTMTSGAWFGSMIPPAPRRMREVSPTRRASMSGGEGVEAPGIEWCLENQSRW